MARVTTHDLMPCGCPAFRNARMFCDGERMADVVAYDAEACTTEVFVRRPDGSLSVVDESPETMVVHGNMRLECKTHGPQA